MVKKQILQKDKVGSVLIMAMVFMVVIAGLVAFFLSQTTTQARASMQRHESVQALYDAYSKLEVARVIIADSDYDQEGNNMAVKQAFDSGTNIIAGTDVTISNLTGNIDGSWYLITANSSYDGGRSERVVSRAFRDKDYYSSYNMFVSADPVGVAGKPVGPIHTNRQLQFYFPNGVYRYALTAVEGAVYRAGATEDNTTVLAPINTHADRIDLDMEDSKFGINTLKSKVLPEYSFPADRDLEIELVQDGENQNLLIKEYSQPRIDYTTEQVFDYYKNVNPREEQYQEDEQVITGYETKTRDKTVYHSEDVVVTNQVPVYREETQYEDVPVYVQEERTKEVPRYVTVTKTRQVEKQVWIEDPLDISGGTAIGGDGGGTGHYETVTVDETYNEQVLDGYDTQTYYVNVVDHYESQPKTVQVVDHYEEVQTTETQQVAETVQEEYQSPIYETQTVTKTRTVYDQEAVYKTVYHPVYVSRVELDSKQLPVPPNGIVYSAGNIIGLKGNVCGNLSIATEGKIRITGNIIYRDQYGNPAYLNGSDPNLKYEPNPDYDNNAVLGLIARKDVIYGTQVPDNFEINASIMSIEGRVGIDGIELSDNGEIAHYNRIKDEFGRLTNETFNKTSIRRLGGITTYRRPVDTVVTDGKVASGFTRGRSAFDTVILACPPPFYMAMPVPRFFAIQIQQ